MSRLAERFPGSNPPAQRCRFLLPVSLAILWALGGCASIPQDQRDPGDRLESGNRSVYRFNEGLDRMVLKPVSSAYTDHVPQPIRTSVSHFYDNLTYPSTILNNFLQGKVRQSASDLVRFGVNSTIGILGFFDVATPAGLPKHKEDFGQTLAVWGAGTGEYLVYPLIGPSGVRDTGGVVVGWLTNPLFYVAAPVAIPLGVISVVDLRARMEGFVKFRDEAALDPYIFTRESYLQNRRFEVYDGNPPPVKFELFDEAAPEPQAGPAMPEPTLAAPGTTP